MSRAALDRHPADPLAAVHACWLAADDVVAGDFTAAEARLRYLDASSFPSADRWLHTVVTAAVSVGQADTDRRPEVLSDARQSVDAVSREYEGLRRDPARRELLRAVAAQWASEGGLGIRLWACWQRWRH